VVATTTNRGVSYSTKATWHATFAANDTLVATALDDGTVAVYKVGATTTQIGSVVIPAFAASTGYVGMQLAAGTRVDNFAGRNVP
jgi:hypothetical protein